MAIKMDKWGRITDTSGLFGQGWLSSLSSDWGRWSQSLISSSWWIVKLVGYVVRAFTYFGTLLWSGILAILNLFIAVWNYLISAAHLFIDSWGFFQRVIHAVWEDALKPAFVWTATHVRTSLVVILGWLIATAVSTFSIVKENIINLLQAIYDLSLPDVPQVDWGDGAGLVWLVGKFLGVQHAVPALVNITSFAITLAVGYFTVALALTVVRLITGR